MTRALLRWFLPLLFIALAAAGSYWMFASQPEARTRPAPRPQPTLVEVQRLQPEAFTLRFRSQGTILPRSTVTLQARTGGEVLSVAPNWHNGSAIERGQTLLQIDPRDAELELSSARAALAQARAGLQEERARAEQARREWRTLGRSGQPPALVARSPQLASAQANVQSASTRLEAAELALQRTTITAPFDGYVLDTQVSPGQLVSPGTALGTAYALDQLAAELPISQSDFVRLPTPSAEAPLAVTLRLPERPDQAIPAQVRYFASQLEADTQLVTLYAELSEEGRRLAQRLPLAGQFVNAEITGSVVDNVFVLPQRALRADNQVLIVEDGLIAPRHIRPVFSDGEVVVTREGVQNGDAVITTPLGSAVIGTAVRIQGEEAEAPGERPDTNLDRRPS